MPEVVLHDYLHEIDRLIEESHLEEAVRHCRQILKQFPRHVDTYRQLGKALLEQGEFEGAMDVFQRVLSVDPEDFIAHAGIAIIRKQENRLREAAWHMERAFEMEPYNGAIREALQDLIGRRDGLPPEQLSLTRGALARLYVRGELYPHAISDLRQLLAEEPDRVDLQVLLAEALWRNGQRIDAAEECARVLERLPNCIKANAILAEVGLTTDRVDEAHAYLRRVFELALPTSAMLTQDTAVGLAFRTKGSPPLTDKIMVQRAEHQADLGVSADTADWVNDLDLGDELALADMEPQWLGAMQDAGATESSATNDSDLDVDSQYSAGDVDAGAEDEGTNLFSRSADQLPGIGEVREETDWEGWLEPERDVALPAEPDSSNSSDVEEVGMGAMDERGNNGDGFPEADDPQRSGAGAAGEDDALDWLDELEEAEEPTQADQFGGLDSSDLPDWLREGVDVDDAPVADLDWLDEPAEERGAAEKEEAADGAELPDWLRDEVEGAAENTAGADDLSWLDQIAAGEGAPLEEPPTMSWSDADDEDEVTLFEEWDAPPEGRDAQETEAVFETGIPEAPDHESDDATLPSELEDDQMRDEAPEDIEEAMAWLEQLAAQQGAPKEELPSLANMTGHDKQDLTEDVPDELDEAMDWLDELARAEDDAGYEPLAFAEMDDTEESVSAEDTRWLDEFEDEGVEPDVFAAEQGDVEFEAGIGRAEFERGEFEQEADVDEAMAWLEQLAGEGTGEDAIEDDLTSWTELEDRADAEALGELDDIPDDPELALAWLEGLAETGEAADEGVEELADVVEEEATPTVPHDVVAARAEAEAILLHDLAPADEESRDSEMLEDIPDDPDEAMAWLERLAARQGAPRDELPSLAEDDSWDEAIAGEAPDWLEDEAYDIGLQGEEEVEVQAERDAADALGEPEYDEFDALTQDKVDDAAPAFAEALESGEVTEDYGEESEVAPEEVSGEDALEDALPEWLALDEEDEASALDWDEAALDSVDWLDAEEYASDTESSPDEALAAATAAYEDAEMAPEVVEEEAAPEVLEEELEPALETSESELADLTERLEEAEELDVPGDAEEVIEPLAGDVHEFEATVAAGDEVASDAWNEARQALEDGRVEDALQAYRALLEGGEDVSTLIAELEQATEEFESQPGLMQVLGDAYNRNGQLQKALDAYRQALTML